MDEQVIGIDVGGTTMKGGRYSGSRCLQRSDVPTPVSQGPDAVVAAIRSLARALARPGPARVVAAGVVVPGIVDSAGGIARYSANLGWRDVPLRQLLEDDLGIPIAVDHDVRAAALAEAAVLSASQSLFVSIGTGVFAARVVDGRVDRGASGLAGELGHFPVRAGGILCGCGQRGCLEVYASATAIARRYAAAGGTPGLTAADIGGRLTTDPIAERIWSQAVKALATGLTAAVLLTDPEVVVIGGGLAAAGETLLAPLRLALAAQLAWRPIPSLVRGRFGMDAGRVGAAALASALSPIAEPRGIR